ncbi:hypothetical protein EV182_001232 [Spiromyces aspiralis]|uniref:Uncharacterized protein n=1 Tax=Spiromyces aspiralis TaxID=68401 RepID=A0ACC1HTD5_9FUNG|nr:hypothetical protein EV182_001232 [Spiromyces aspiralis]
MGNCCSSNCPHRNGYGFRGSSSHAVSSNTAEVGAAAGRPHPREHRMLSEGAGEGCLCTDYRHAVGDTTRPSLRGNSRRRRNRRNRRPCTRCGRRQASCECAEVDLSRNLVWESDIPMTRDELTRQREMFWETAPVYSGRQEIWQALHEVCTTDDEELARAIIHTLGIKVPSGCLQDGCFDELGNYYDLPEFCFSDPTNLITESLFPSVRERDSGITSPGYPAMASASVFGYDDGSLTSVCGHQSQPQQHQPIASAAAASPPSRLPISRVTTAATSMGPVQTVPGTVTINASDAHRDNITPINADGMPVAPGSSSPVTATTPHPNVGFGGGDDDEGNTKFVAPFPKTPYCNSTNIDDSFYSHRLSYDSINTTVGPSGSAHESITLSRPILATPGDESPASPPPSAPPQSLIPLTIRLNTGKDVTLQALATDTADDIRSRLLSSQGWDPATTRLRFFYLGKPIPHSSAIFDDIVKRIGGGSIAIIQAMVSFN